MTALGATLPQSDKGRVARIHQLSKWLGQIVDNCLRMRPTAIIFDLDGTLLDDDFAVEMGLLAFHVAYEETLGMSLSDLRLRWLELLRQHFAPYLHGEVSMQEQRRMRIRKLFDEKRSCLTDEEADAAFSVYDRAYTAGWRTFPEVHAALAALRGFRLAVLTNGQADQQRTKLAATKIANRFERIFVSSEIGAAKPDPAAFRHVTAELGVRESDCILVGDNIDIDIRGATRAGIAAILVNRRVEPSADPPKVVTVSNLLDMVALVRSHDG